MHLPIVVLLVVGAGALAQVVPQSPCPDMFQYVRSDFPSWKGLVSIQQPSPGATLKLKVELYLEAALPTKYAGRLQLVDGKDEVSQKLISGSKEPIKYEVQFPLPFPVPHINRITVNQDIVCEGPVVTSRILTKISLEHTLYPVVTTLVVPGHNGFFPGGLPTLTFPEQPLEPPYPEEPDLGQQGNPNPSLVEYGQTTTTTVKPPPWRPKPSKATPKPVLPSDSDICGQPVTANQLVLNGRHTRRGEWPWLVAIFIRTDIGQEFRCSGTLINRRYVVTAAHCIKTQKGESALRADELGVYLGKYNVKRFAEPDSQAREVDQAIIHPDYGLDASFDADLAMLRLSMLAEYSRYVIPICMWDRSTDLQDVVGMTGTVVGWGRDERGNKVSEEPRLAEVPIVAQEICLFSQKEFVTFTSNRTFCGGYKNETGPCNGDSGSGLVLPFIDGSIERWYLRGIVSFSLLNKDENRCDLRNYIVFTDVAKHTKWLSQFQEDRRK